MARTLGLVKRVDLSEFAEGWDGCHALVAPVTYGELKTIKQWQNDLDEDTAVDTIVAFVKDHLKGGSVKVLDASGQLTEGQLLPEDVEQMPPDMINALFGVITGGGAQYRDPKASPTAPSSSDEPQTSDEPTETS